MRIQACECVGATPSTLAPLESRSKACHHTYIARHRHAQANAYTHIHKCKHARSNNHNLNRSYKNNTTRTRNVRLIIMRKYARTPAYMNSVSHICKYARCTEGHHPSDFDAEVQHQLQAEIRLNCKEQHSSNRHAFITSL